MVVEQILAEIRGILLVRRLYIRKSSVVFAMPTNPKSMICQGIDWSEIFNNIFL